MEFLICSEIPGPRSAAVYSEGGSCHLYYLLIPTNREIYRSDLSFLLFDSNTIL